MQGKKFLFVGARLKVLNTMLKLRLNTTAFIFAGTFAARMMKGKCTEFSSKNELLALIEGAEFDILVSNGCPYILPVSKLKKSGQIFVNLHPSLLPKLRGAAPINASILLNEEAGATCHMMDDGVDSGDIIAWQRVKNNKSVNLSLLYQLCFYAEARAFEKALRRKFRPRKKQDEKKASYYKRNEKDMSLNLAADSDEFILRKVRAFSLKGQMVSFDMGGGNALGSRC